MAALVFHVCAGTLELWDLADAFVRGGFSLSRALRYLRVKRRLQLFERNRCEVNECERRRLVSFFATRIEAIVSKSCGTMPRGRNMAGIDFAAIEASAEAYEVIDSFAANRRGGGGGGGGGHPLTPPLTAASLDVLDFYNAERRHTEDVENFDDIEVISGLEVDTSFYEYIDSLPVYHARVLLAEEGDSFTFYGYIRANCERFSINFLLDNETRDVALHINPRLPQNYIVRNTKVKGLWGREEVSSPLPFSLRRGSKFAIQVLYTKACYMISVNGHHFAEYAHRLPPSAVELIEVKGDVDSIDMERHKVTSYPQRLPASEPKPIALTYVKRTPPSSPCGVSGGAGTDETDLIMPDVPREWRQIRIVNKRGSTPSPGVDNDTGLALPYYGWMPAQSLTVGRCLKIEGRVKLLPHSFYINLQQGQNIWPHPIIAFHFNPRFSKQSGAIGKAIVCRNAWYNGTWAEEERSELDTDFRPGKPFSLAIFCEPHGFTVHVNGKYITEFSYYVEPALVDTVYVQGDIKLWRVVVEKMADSQNGNNKNIYRNPAYTDEY